MGGPSAEVVGCGPVRGLQLRGEPTVGDIAVCRHCSRLASTSQRRPGVTPFAYVLPSDDLDLAKSTFAPFVAYAESHPDTVNLTISFVEEPTWHALWSGEFEKALMALDEVGINLLLGGRLIPEEVVRDEEGGLAEFLAESKSPAIVHLGESCLPLLGVSGR